MNRTRGRDPRRVEAEAEQRRREDEAPRLRDAVASLESLRLRFSDVRLEGRQTTPPYVKPVVVATAPAHFEVRCTDKDCDGRHDLTRPLMHALRASQQACSGESSCNGMIGDMPCDHTLVYTAEATYSG
jgi:hypothetical protein